MRPPQHVRRMYGDKILHLIILIAALALAGYTVSVLGVGSLFNPMAWWQSIAVWFAVAVIGHDLVLFPLYAMAERLLPRQCHPSSDRTHQATQVNSRRVPVINYLRLPTMATGLTFLLFYPGIIQQGAGTYTAASGLTQEPFLDRWLLLTAVFYLTSALCYVAKTVYAHRTSPGAPAPPTDAVPEPSTAGSDTT
jgi:hypothetical protein